MPVSPQLKRVLAALTTWPLVYVVIFATLASRLPRAAGSHTVAPAALVTLLVVHLLTIADLVCLFVYFAIFIARTRRLRPVGKVLWVVALFAANILAMPIFFWVYVWPEEGPA
jgi:hypothetical protein